MPKPTWRRGVGQGVPALGQAFQAQGVGGVGFGRGDLAQVDHAAVPGGDVRPGVDALGEAGVIAEVRAVHDRAGQVDDGRSRR